MTTKYLTLTDYRNNISRYTAEAQRESITYIILIHSRPVFEVKPILPEEDTRELVYPAGAREKWKIAREELARGEAVSLDEIRSIYMR